MPDTSEPTAESTDIRAALAALSRRVDNLEGARATPPASSLWALDELRRQRAQHPSTAEGAVLLSGSVTLPGGTPVEWQQSASSSELLASEWGERSAAFAALGHPVRVELLRHVLNGVHGTAELAGIESLGTTGQLHHHLRQLLGAGWLRQSARGSYEVPASRVVPLLVCLAAVGK
ncbi:ArsR/SmtB family transcription factor [Microterricola viridarii]|uniref:Helix-turn-helix domain-containing protein n=1 Tax=Microterricola viridarii TaxID=412690 RepID=A0A1H1VLX7_9MICO|nr:ArsR family transcriptional regulator [Microterricola viridarii]SDS85792.1 hypothetical protein SAMN04489834_2302 [Microterricola viridarii]